jgi:two-component system nitrate/nitrite response regulator NarL
MPPHIRVAILDDHQSIIDGYTYRISSAPHIEVVATALYGEELEPMLESNSVDVLLLDISVPNSPENHNPYPIMYLIPRLLQRHPGLNILVISMYTQHALVETLVNAGISGYIFKDDEASIQQLAKIVEIVAGGGIFFSQGAYKDMRGEQTQSILTPRQLEALSLCAAQPDGDTVVLADKLGITGSTMRNLLSGAYLRLGVRTRAAAIARAQQLGIFPALPEAKSPVVEIPRKNKLKT